PRFVINEPFGVNRVGAAFLFLLDQPLASRVVRLPAFEINVTEATILSAKLFGFRYERRISYGLDCHRADHPNNKNDYCKTFDLLQFFSPVFRNLTSQNFI